jgi:hypothetical protein
MIPFLQVRPNAHPYHRASRLQLLGGALLGFAVLAVWDPVAHPGPKCCLLRLAFGLPCPVCGMTRGVAMCERGRFLEATIYNPMSVPFCIVALALCGVWAYEFAMKKSVIVTLAPMWRKALWAAVGAAVLASWAYMLLFRREDDFASTWLGHLLHHFWP